MEDTNKKVGVKDLHKNYFGGVFMPNEDTIHIKIKNTEPFIKNIKSVVTTKNHECIVVNYIDGTYDIFTKKEFFDLFRDSRDSRKDLYSVQIYDIHEGLPWTTIAEDMTYAQAKKKTIELISIAFDGFGVRIINQTTNEVL